MSAEKKTLPYLSRKEKTRVIGERIRQIESGAKSQLKKAQIDELIKQAEQTRGRCSVPELIAREELHLKILPFKIIRPLLDGTEEVYKLSELIDVDSL